MRVLPGISGQRHGDSPSGHTAGTIADSLANDESIIPPDDKEVHMTELATDKVLLTEWNHAPVFEAVHPQKIFAEMAGFSLGFGRKYRTLRTRYLPRRPRYCRSARQWTRITEGFTTAEMKEANALLATLSS
jgi:hypothetical protein